MFDIRPVILASQSPRRHELLDLAGIPHTVFVSGANEGSVTYKKGHPEDFAISTAELKCHAVRDALRDPSCKVAERDRAIVIAADTVVYSENEGIFGKPKDEAEASRMLRSLSGTTHRVITGVVMYDTVTGQTSRFAEVTAVSFRELSQDEIDTYIREFRPLDKAGAYGIQDGACVFVRGIVGDYYNVVGLPVCHVFTELARLAGAKQ